MTALIVLPMIAPYSVLAANWSTINSVLTIEATVVCTADLSPPIPIECAVHWV